MNKFLLILICIIATSSIFAQNKILVRGKVFDSETGKPVSEVHVFVKGSTEGTITDASGNYSVYIEKKKDTLVYSHIQYEVFDSAYYVSTINADVLLDPKISILAEAVIKPIMNISKGMMFDVTDYFFIGDNILYSGYCYHYKKNRNPWLLLKTSKGDTIFSECVGKEGTFFKDCFDNIHYITEKTAYQLVIENDSIWFEYPTRVDEFMEAMENCHMEVNNKVIVSQYYNSNQVLIYYLIDKETIETEIFRTVADEAKLNMFIYRGLFFSMGPPPSEADLRFEELIMYKPVFAPIIKAREKIFIINYAESIIESYDTCFQSLNKVPIYFHNVRFCKDEIVVDNVTGKVYAVFRNRGKTSVKEIDIDKGEIGQEIDIPDFYWIDNIKINNGKLYFLYREKYSTKLRSLYRMNLD
jgi:hypothetical protein